MASFYILWSPALDRYYIGHTTLAMAECLRRHLSSHRGWTARAKDWKVAHVEILPSKAPALHRERDVKGWKSRDRILELIALNDLGKKGVAQSG